MNFVISTLFYFLIYSLFGWLLEGFFNLFMKGSFMKEGFLLGPFKPMYGIAATILVLLEPFMPSYLFLLMLLVVPTVVEYLTGYLMGRFFDKRYWDYSHLPFQYKGHVCLYFSLSWLLVAFVAIYFIQPLVAVFYTSWRSVWYVIVPIIILYLLVDLSLVLKKKDASLF